ncbi:MAG: CRISPR-associated protein Cas4 [Methanothrix sp.]|nr:CRISPR-associated protein Cas4 [Methanothrix sp.]HNR56957.1 CRISPR-associated protein Cas4 [Methanothrix sp.]HOI69854.1 CRISPR-associated protein Cas4 [Methanothrix sp.]
MTIDPLMAQPVRIFDVSLYLRCPRLLYFQAMGRKVHPEAAAPATLLMREVALSLSEIGPEEAADLGGWLREALERALVELPAIFPDRMNPHDLQAAAEEVGAWAAEVAPRMVLALQLITPSTVEVDLRSDRLGISGRVDRVVSRGDEDGTPNVKVPSMMRVDLPPEAGVWRSDRLRLAGYAMLLEEKLETRVDLGLVEYLRAGEVREVEIRPTDRRRVLRIRDRVRLIGEGKLPDRPREAPCDRCPVLDACETRQTLASKFF